MSVFYGTVVGSARTHATRRGSKASGIEAAAQSWTGSISVGLTGDPDDPTVVIRVGSGSTHRPERELGRFNLAAALKPHRRLALLVTDMDENAGECWASTAARAAAARMACAARTRTKDVKADRE